MTSILIIWFTAALTAAGFGCGVCALYHRLAAPVHTDSARLLLFPCIWLGTAVLLGLVQIISLLLPLDHAVSLTFTGIGLMLLLRFHRYIQLPVTGSRRLPLCAFLLMAVLTWLTVDQLSTPAWPGVYDTDLYHFQVVEWANSYPAVKGLGNLHGRLAKPSGYLLLAALTDYGPLDGRSAWIMGAWIPWLAALHVIWLALYDLRKSPVTRCAALLLLPYLCRQAAAIRPGLAYDEPAMVLQLLILLILMKQLTLKETEQPAQPLLLAALGAMAALAVAIKLSAAVTFILTAGLLTRLLYRQRDATVLRRVLLIASISVLLLGGMLLRNAVQSGWLLYPAPVGRLPVSWAMPAEACHMDNYWQQVQSVDGQYRIIRAWARVPNKPFQTVERQPLNDWVSPWFVRNRAHPAVMAAMVGGCLLLLNLLICRRMRYRRIWLLLTGFTVANVFYWFFTAPDLRFGAGFLWAAAAVQGAFLMQRLPAKAALTVGTVAAVSITCMNLNDFRGHAIESWWLPGRAEARETYPKTMHSPSGTWTVHIPRNNDRSGNAPIPSTPYPLNTLHAYDASDLGKGFYREPCD